MTEAQEPQIGHIQEVQGSSPESQVMLPGSNEFSLADLTSGAIISYLVVAMEGVQIPFDHAKLVEEYDRRCLGSEFNRP